MTYDEFEAIRLADVEGLYQDEAAKRMQVSRQTFGNILASARRKLGEMLVFGRSLNIRGKYHGFIGREIIRVCGLRTRLVRCSRDPASC